MDVTESHQNTFDLGTWLGRRQAFSVIAGKCSAADVECLRTLRKEKQYRYLGLNWEQFCKKHLGIARAVADRLIRQLEEFGPVFFQLGGVTRITPEEYRLIAGAVTEGGLAYEGETIPITEQNGPRLAEAVEALRLRAAPAEDGSGAGETERALATAHRSWQAAIAVYERLRAGNLNETERLGLSTALGEARAALDRIAAGNAV
jgi:hypothetical protein